MLGSETQSPRSSSVSSGKSSAGTKCQMRVAVRFRPLQVDALEHNGDANSLKGNTRGRPQTPPVDTEAISNRIQTLGVHINNLQGRPTSVLTPPKRRGSYVGDASPNSFSVDMAYRDRTSFSIQLQTHDGKTQQKSYTFDRVFSPESNQKQVYEEVVQPIISDVIEGYNGTVIAYGQTGSGKTHTMIGPDLDSDSAGIIPRSFVDIFRYAQSMPEDANVKITCSYLQIYMENISDLLNPRKSHLRIMENARGEVFVENLSEEVIESAEEALDLLSFGEKNRVYSTTNMNVQSSRSHCVFMVHVSQSCTDGSVKKGTLNFVDLAGSEKVFKSGIEGLTLEEGKKINLSLSSLGRVIHALSENPKGHIPYRDSRITRILQDSLGGNSKTSVIITCSPSASNLDETISSLAFGQSAKTIKNNVRINRLEDIDALHKTIEYLKNQLETAKLANKKASLEFTQENQHGVDETIELHERLEQNQNRILELENGLQNCHETIHSLVAQNKVLEEYLQIEISKNQSEDIRGSSESEIVQIREKYEAVVLEMLEKDSRLARALTELEYLRTSNEQLVEHEQKLRDLLGSEQNKIESVRARLEAEKRKTAKYASSLASLKQEFNEQSEEMKTLSDTFNPDALRKVYFTIQELQEKIRQYELTMSAKKPENVSQPRTDSFSQVQTPNLLQAQDQSQNVVFPLSSRSSTTPAFANPNPPPIVYASPMRVSHLTHGVPVYMTTAQYPPNTYINSAFHPQSAQHQHHVAYQAHNQPTQYVIPNTTQAQTIMNQSRAVNLHGISNYPNMHPYSHLSIGNKQANQSYIHTQPLEATPIHVSAERPKTLYSTNSVVLQTSIYSSP